MVRDPRQLWSPYGIRSLSLQEPLFGQGENYWRGPIWIQMNYMALSALHKVGARHAAFGCSLSWLMVGILAIALLQVYAKEPGPNQVRAAQIYAELRSNIVENVFNVSFSFPLFIYIVASFYGELEELTVCWSFRSTSGPTTCGNSTTP